MGNCAPIGVFDYDVPFDSPKQKQRREQTYLEYVKERKEIELLMNPKKWWEFWR